MYTNLKRHEGTFVYNQYSPFLSFRSSLLLRNKDEVPATIESISEDRLPCEAWAITRRISAAELLWGPLASSLFGPEETMFAFPIPEDPDRIAELAAAAIAAAAAVMCVLEATMASEF